MGLDMYLHGKISYWQLKEEKEGFPLVSKTYELGYWRRHSNLHEFIVQTFADNEDKCQEIYLSLTDLQLIHDAINMEALSNSPCEIPDDSYRSSSLEIIEKSMNWLKNGDDDHSEYREIYYQASW